MFSKSKIVVLIFSFGLASQALAGKKATPADDDWGDEPTAKVTSTSKWHVTASYLESYFFQGARQVETSLNDIYNLSTFTGLNSGFSAGGEYEFYPSWRLMAALLYRQVVTTGTATEASTGFVETFKLSQTFFGVQGGLRYTLESAKRWSLVALGEYDKGSSISLTVTSGPSIAPVTLALPTYVIFMGGVYYDMPFAKTYHFDSGFKAGAVVTTNPFSVIGELSLGLRRSF